MLRAGPGAVLSHETAAEIHGLTDQPSSPDPCQRPGRAPPRPAPEDPGVVIHRSRGLVPQWQPPWQLPRTTVEDTVLDLVAAARTFDDAYGWISAAVGRRLTSPSAEQGARRPLADTLASLDHRGPAGRRRWRPLAAGAHYVYGVERAHGLPTARRQARRRHGSGARYLDNLYEDYGLCVELDGHAAHPAEGRWRDTHRDNDNLVQGTATLRYGWPDATEHRCRTAAEIAAVLRRRGWPGTLRRCGPACLATGPQNAGPQ